MNGKVVIAFGCCVSLSGCIHGPYVLNDQDAILVGRNTCYDRFAKDFKPDGRAMDMKDWQARSVGDHWKVYKGDKDNPIFWINVRKDGRPPRPDDCAFYMDEPVLR